MKIASIGLFLLLLGIPVALSISPGHTLLGELIFIVIFFFPGYLIGIALGDGIGETPISTEFVVGIVTVTAAYDVFSVLRIASYFFIFIGLISAVGAVSFAYHLRQSPLQSRSRTVERETFTVGCIVALCLAPLFWRSGRFSGDEFVFYGPAGRDHLYHLTLLQRLSFHVPPDNFIVSGLKAPVYHYFSDLVLSAVFHLQNALHIAANNPFDLYYRCYPSFLYFCIGASAYAIGRRILGSPRGGVLAILLLLGAGGLPWVFGVLQSAVHVSNPSLMRSAMFSDWSAWDGVGSILPLVHRPAHYHGMLICLTAIYLLLHPKRSLRNWILGGLLLGLLAGFNFTLAAILGVATVVATLILLVRRQQEGARQLAILAVSMFIGSLPVNAVMLFSGFHQTAPGFPFRGPSLEYTSAVWGPLIGHLLPISILPWVSLIIFVAVAYGVKLFGVGALARLDLGGGADHEIALVLAIAIVLSLIIGLFFPYQGIGGGNIIFLQPTLWMLALFSLRPISAWLERQRGWRAIALWSMLGLTWMQSLTAFHLSSKVAVEHQAASVLAEIRSTADPDDVIAYLPTDWTTSAIFGRSATFPDYVFMAMTGLDGYFANETYTKFYAASSLSGLNATEVFDRGERLYEERRACLEDFLSGKSGEAASTKLASDKVRWIVVSGDAMSKVATQVAPWRKTDQVEVWKLPR